MRKLVVSEFISLDGVVEAPETWHFPYIDDETQAYTNGRIQATDAFLYGRKTYDIFAGYWTSPNAPQEIAEPLNRTPKFVVSNTLQEAIWKGTTILSGNPAESVAKVKAEGDGLLGMTGSVMLVQALLAAGLVDELHLLLHPVVVGHGQKLFKDGMDRIGLKLAESRTFKLGVVALVYQPEKTS